MVWKQKPKSVILTSSFQFKKYVKLPLCVSLMAKSYKYFFYILSKT